MNTINPKFKLGKFTFEKYEGSCDRWPDIVNMEWIEGSTDSYYSDSDMDMDITREDSINLINFLKDSFNISDDELILSKIQ